MPNFGRKTKILLTVLLILGTLFLLRITGPERDELSFAEKAVKDVMAPMQHAATSVFNWFDNLPLYFGAVSEVIAENERLEKEIVALQEELAALSSAYVENVRLREMLDIADEMSEWVPVSSKVIARSDASWYNSITISGGENKGFKKNMAVITAAGLVGRIDSVSAYSSEVLLLHDANCPAAAMLQASKAYGIVEADDDNDTVLQMVHISYDTNVEEGQVVITSGLGGIFPAGLRIGYIAGVSSDAGGLMQKASIIPFADFERLSDVLVLTRSVDTAEGGIR